MSYFREGRLLRTIEQIADSVADSYDDFDRDIIQAKWAMDGSTSLLEAAAKLTAYANSLIDLHDAGWRLSGAVTSGEGFIRKSAEPIDCEFKKIIEVWTA